MDLLDERGTGARKIGVTTISRGNSMVAEEPIAGRQVRSSYRSLAVGVERNIRSQRGCDRCQVLISEILKCHRTGRSRSWPRRIRNGGSEGDRLAGDKGANVGRA